MKNLLLTLSFSFVLSSVTISAEEQKTPFSFSAPESQILSGISHTVIVSPDQKSIWGYSKLTGKWDSVKISVDDQSLSGPMMSTHHTSYVIRNQIVAFSAQTGKWSSYKLPKDNKAEIIPTMGTNVLAFLAEDQLVAYGTKSGKWDSIKIDPTKVKYVPLPADGLFQVTDQGQQQQQVAQIPLLANDVAGGQIGNIVYAFSSSSSKWEKVEFPEGETPVVMVSNDSMEAKSQNFFYMFSSATNKWSGLKVKTRKNNPASLEQVK